MIINNNKNREWESTKKSGQMNAKKKTFGCYFFLFFFTNCYITYCNNYLNYKHFFSFGNYIAFVLIDCILPVLFYIHTYSNIRDLL